MRAVTVILVMVLTIANTDSVLAQHIFEKTYKFDYATGATIAQCAASAIDTTIVSCASLSDGSREGVLSKIDPHGAVVWSYRFSASEVVYFSAVTVLDDGSIVVAGNISGSGTSLLMRFDRTANLQWCHRYFVAGGFTPTSIARSHDGGFILLGDAPLIIRTDSSGNFLWGRFAKYTIERSLGASFNQVIEHPNSTLVIVGTLRSEPVDQPVVQFLTTLNLSAEGEFYSGFSYKLPGSNLRFPMFLKLPDTTMVAAIGTTDDQNTAQSVLVHFADIDVVASSTILTTFSNTTIASLALSTTDELIGQLAPPYGSHYNYVVCRLTADGIVKDMKQGRKILSTYEEQLLRLEGSAGENYIVRAGDEYRGMSISTVSNALSTCESSLSLYSNNPISLPRSLMIPDLFPLTAEDTTIALARVAIPITTTTICDNQENAVIAPASSSSELLLSPNPVAQHSVLSVSLPHLSSGTYEVYMRNITGRVVLHSIVYPSANSTIALPTAGLASGVYTVELLDANSFANVWRGKVVVE